MHDCHEEGGHDAFRTVGVLAVGCSRDPSCYDSGAELLRFGCNCSIDHVRIARCHRRSGEARGGIHDSQPRGMSAHRQHVG